MSNHKNNNKNSNEMPRLFGSPSPDVIRKYLLKARNHFASKTENAWERIFEVNQVDANGTNVVDANGNNVMVVTTSIESMLLIFPDGSTAGRYPIPIEVREPVAAASDTNFEKEKKIVKWKNEMTVAENQRKSIINNKLSYSGELKLSISNEIQDVMRRQAAGRDALDGNDPLEIINVLISTDFSVKATVAASPLIKYEEAIERFNGDNLRQEFNETLDAWEKRFGSERVNLNNIALVAGKSTEVPNEESMAYRFFMRTNGIYKQVREDVRTGTRAGGFPKTVVSAMEILRPFEKPGNRISVNNNNNRVRGVYVAEKKENKKGWSHRCPLHKSNEHDYNDSVCNEIIKCGKSSDNKQGRVTKSVNDNRKKKS